MYYTNSGRKISYNGTDYSEDLIVINEQYKGKVDSLNDLFSKMLKSWTRDSAHKVAQNDKTFNLDADPTYGQCAVTALVVQDIFGGTVHRALVAGLGPHYFNKINGKYYDLTNDQYDIYEIPLNYESNHEVDRETCYNHEDTYNRYNILVNNLNKNI